MTLPNETIRDVLATATAFLLWKSHRHARNAHRRELFERRAGHADLVFATPTGDIETIDLDHVLRAPGLDLPRPTIERLAELLHLEAHSATKTRLCAVKVLVQNQCPLPITDVIVELEGPAGSLPRHGLSTSAAVLLPGETTELEVYIPMASDRLPNPLYGTPWFVDAFGGVWANPLKRPAMIMSFPQMNRAAWAWHRISTGLPGRRQYVLWSARRQDRRRRFETKRFAALMEGEPTSDQRLPQT